MAWLGACGLAFGNAIIRQAIFEGHIGTNQAALVIGAIWAMLTLAFEFGFGHWVAGQSRAELLAAYNLADGRVWVLIPLWTMIAPATMRALQQSRRS